MLRRRWEILAMVCALVAISNVAQTQQVAMATATANSASAVVPRLVKFSGTLLDEQGHAMRGPVGVTFALYAQQSGGAALWMETQNVKPDASGNYTVLLGAASANGIPEELFASGEARWLGVQAEGQAEQPRVLLVSVPYALKAADAQTLAGLPASAFLTASSQSGKVPAPDSALVVTTPLVAQPSGITAAPTGSGSSNTIPLWTSSTNLGNSNITQVGGIVSVKDTLQLPATGTATALAGKNSQPFDLLASSFNSTLATGINQHFRWQAEPVGNNSASPSGKLNLLFGQEAAAPAETGLSISSKGLFSFVPGQTFPGTGTITSVGLSAPATDFKVSGSPVTKSGTLALSWNFAPTSADTANAIVKRDSTGSFAAEAITANSAGGPAVFGQNTGTGGFSDGVHGVTSSAGASGVAGVNNSGGIGVFGVGGTGTFGTSNTASGIGVNGVFGPTSSEGAGTAFVGVWGDTGSGGATAVKGTADDGLAIEGFNDSASSETSFFENLTTSSSTALVFETFGNFFGGVCTIDVSGTITCNGTTITAPTLSGGRKVAFYGVGAAENLFEDFGSGQLSKGVATVALDPTFADAVNTGMGYHVYLTPDGDCKGLYVAQKTPTSFAVHELGGGLSNVAFDYRIVAHRKGFENRRLEDMTEHFKQQVQRGPKMSPPGKAPIPARPNRRPSLVPPAAHVSKPALNSKSERTTPNK